MVVIEEEVVNILTQIGEIGLWLQTIGIIIVLWIIFQVVSFIINRKNRNTLKYLREDINRLERKIDKLPKKDRR